jgi:hypothetical protein
MPKLAPDDWRLLPLTPLASIRILRTLSAQARAARKAARQRTDGAETHEDLSL